MSSHVFHGKIKSLQIFNCGHPPTLSKRVAVLYSRNMALRQLIKTFSKHFHGCAKFPATIKYIYYFGINVYIGRPLNGAIFDLIGLGMQMHPSPIVFDLNSYSDGRRGNPKRKKSRSQQLSARPSSPVVNTFWKTHPSFVFAFRKLWLMTTIVVIFRVKLKV